MDDETFAGLRKSQLMDIGYDIQDQYAIEKLSKTILKITREKMSKLFDFLLTIVCFKPLKKSGVESKQY